MKQLEILCQWAGHCTSGSSNKVWIACLARERDQQDTSSPVALSETTQVVMVSAYGPYGSALRLSNPQRLSWKAAQALFQSKKLEKMGKGYATVAFAPFLAQLGQPLGLPLILPSAMASLTSPEVPAPLQAGTPGSETAWRYTAALVKPIERKQLLALLADESEGHPSPYGISEKANGERCVLEFDGNNLRAYNRKGKLTSAPPACAQALCRLGHPFVIDGERLLGEQAGWFAAFDVLEWQGESLLTQPYRSRLTRLVRGMRAAGLLHSEGLTPLLRQAWENSTVPGLGVLLAMQGAIRTRAVLKEVEETGLEGVVLRYLQAPYAEGGFKYKILVEVDAFVIGVKPGVSAGSLTLAMVRPADQAIIEVGHVRSGLHDSDIRLVQTRLEQGAYPVFRVSYLPASTSGLSLVQPQTSMECLRADKEARECTTEQLGPAKAFLIALARPVLGVRLEATRKG